MKPIRVAIGIVAVAITAGLGFSLPAGAGDEPTETTPETTEPPTTEPPEVVVVEPLTPTFASLDCKNPAAPGYIAIVTIPDVEGVAYSYEDRDLGSGREYWVELPGALTITARPVEGYAFAEVDEVNYTLEIPDIAVCAGPAGPPGPPGPASVLPTGPASLPPVAGPARPVVANPTFAG